MQSTFIYSLSDPITNEVRYIGKSSNPQKRYKHHLVVKYYTHKSMWIQSLLKNGIKPSLQILDEVPINEWEFWERHYISLYKSFGFYLTNSVDGGRGGIDNRTVRESTIEKIRLANTGKKHSDASKEKMRQVHLGKVMSDETKEKLRIANIGKKMSAEAIEKTAQSNRERKNTEETKEVIRQKLKGRKRDESAVLKMAETNKVKILQYDLSDNFIKEWSSIKEAKLALSPTNNGLSDVLKGKRKTWIGYKWKYK